MTKDKKVEKLKEQVNCGLIMPIAPMPGYPDTQFLDVRTILTETINNITTYDFKPKMVSDSDGEIDIIHNSIVNNIYDDPIVVVDISGRNGNVMLELGLRLAFDKPVVIIKDDRTDYMFDISMIEHITYPADLRHTQILEFQENLQLKIVKTYEKSVKFKDYSPFLKNFQRIKVKTIDDKDLNESETLQMILNKINIIEKNQFNNSANVKPFFGWKVGDRAIHKAWGIGTVVRIGNANGVKNDLELDIAFPEKGIKRLLAAYAPIEKVDMIDLRDTE